MELKDKLKYSLSFMGQLQKLILINIIFFIFPLLLNTFLWLLELKDLTILDYFVVEADLMSLIFKPWSLITYGFLHGSFSHLFWNMIMLFYFGNILVNYFGDKRLLNVFFNGILFGGVIYITSYNLFPVFEGVSSKMIGSSAGVMAILFYITSYNPNHTIRFFFVNIKLLYIAVFLLIMDIIRIPLENSGGHIAHLGGALIGFLMFKSFNGIDFVDIYTKLILKKNNKKIKRNKTNSGPDLDQKKIDFILDKISESGYESLTKEEKSYLFKASNKKK
ncbi:MAG: rhomboid family intramembrane serine protease [Flavobacteriaceae bacterium]|nr:rhomboid family intramembrane serine protease [Flavobacteriaceae bacterium]|tara:strand:+ start:4994 stop:5824 length:831 start_codon:yes stop_codon:yes gene_type:complete